MGRNFPFCYWRSGGDIGLMICQLLGSGSIGGENDSVSETAQIRLRLCQVMATPLSHLDVCVTEETLYRFEGVEPLSCQASSHVASRHALKRLKQAFVSSRCLQDE